MNIEEQKTETPEIEVEAYSEEKGEVKKVKPGRKQLYKPKIKEMFPDFSPDQQELVKKQVDSILTLRRTTKNPDPNKLLIKAAAQKVLEAIDRQKAKKAESVKLQKTEESKPTAPAPKKKKIRYVEV